MFYPLILLPRLTSSRLRLSQSEAICRWDRHKAGIEEPTFWMHGWVIDGHTSTRELARVETRL